MTLRQYRSSPTLVEQARQILEMDAFKLMLEVLRAEHLSTQDKAPLTDAHGNYLLGAIHGYERSILNLQAMGTNQPKEPEPIEPDWSGGKTQTATVQTLLNPNA